MIVVVTRDMNKSRKLLVDAHECVGLPRYSISWGYLSIDFHEWSVVLYPNPDIEQELLVALTLVGYRCLTATEDTEDLQRIRIQIKRELLESRNS